MNRKEEKYGEWSLLENKQDLFILKLTDPKEGVDQLWLTSEQLESLKDFLITRANGNL
jgi:hypothetical protein